MADNGVELVSLHERPEMTLSGSYVYLIEDPYAKSPAAAQATGDSFISGDYFLITMPCVSRLATMPSTTACTSSRVRVRSAWEKKMRTVMDLPASSV